MQPRIDLLTEDLVRRVLDEAFALLRDHGVKVQAPEAVDLLVAAGATADDDVVHLPEPVVGDALATVPHVFHLHDLRGEPTVTYGGDAVQFDPGSSGVHVLDPETLEHRPATTADLTRLVKVAEMLPEIDAQSTAVVCDEIPKDVGDLWRLYVVLEHSARPIVTGAFSIETLHTMIDMAAVQSGGREALARKPRAVFDVCPSPPLIWSAFGARNLIELARAGVPAEMVSMPLAGAAAPVTLLGSIVQHAAECLSGIAIHQAARPGSPIVWGGAPAIFDMRKGTTPMGAVETAMIDAGYAQVGRSLGLPTHTYLGASDAKVVDAQAGLESGITATIGALAGIDMISGAGMLDFLACQSAEKLVVDAEAIAMVKRLLAGVEARTETLALELFEGIAFKGEFLKQRATKDLFALEQHLPSRVIDRDSMRGWLQSGGLDTWARAKERTAVLLEAYERPELDPAHEAELRDLVERAAKDAGVDPVPELALD
jgi:trimethylamine---corrinoid protein Co-methyltransferase